MLGILTEYIKLRNWEENKKMELGWGKLTGVDTNWRLRSGTLYKASRESTGRLTIQANPQLKMNLLLTFPISLATATLVSPATRK